jgi:hypothetical protein
MSPKQVEGAIALPDPPRRQGLLKEWQKRAAQKNFPRLDLQLLLACNRMYMVGVKIYPEDA